MTKQKMSPEDEKQIKLLRAQNAMYEQTKEEIKTRGTKEALRRTEEAQNDAMQQMKLLDAVNTVDSQESTNADDDDEDIFTRLEEHAKEEATNNVSEVPNDMNTKTFIEDDIKPQKISDSNDADFNAPNSNEAYDIIPLPSNGECYKNKISRVPVAYLTAYDENLITSPNLYRDGLVIDLLLKNKVVDKSINVDDLVSGDVDAIILFLRATSYGTDFPVSVTDPQTGKSIETTIDLSSIHTKDFKLKGDENGYFDYTLPKTKKVVKFKYLTRKEEKDLRTLNELENKALVANNIRDAHKTISDALRTDDVLENREKQIILDFNKKLTSWADKIDCKKRIQYNKAITNRMEMQIVSIDGETNRKKIRQMINAMPANDSLHLRRYILENEPGLDFEIEIQRPESMGGGSFKTFLEWGDTVFLNIS